MTIELISQNLESRKIRENLIGNDGIREIVGVKKDNGGGLLGVFKSVVDVLFDAGNWIVKNTLAAVGITFTSALAFFLQTLDTVWTLDWQQSDEDIQQKINALNQNSIQQFGQLLGQVAGWITCGLLPAGGIFLVNELAGLYTLKQVGEEALDELTNSLGDTIRVIARNEAQKMVYHTFKDTRKALKKWNREIEAEDWERKALDFFLDGESEEALKQWGDPQRKPWSVSAAKQRKVEEVKDKNLRAFWDEFFDELGDSCIEALFIVAQSLDNFVLQQKMIRDEVNGEQAIIELKPNREIEDERIILAGGQNHLRSQLPQVMANYQMVENRDVGQWVGESVPSAVKTSPNQLMLRIQLYSKKTPPIRDAKQRASITIPDVKRSALDFNKIKRAIGGNNGYMYGRFKGKARLDNGKLITVFANSSNEAEERLQALAELVEPEIAGITVTEEMKTGLRANGKPLEKEPIRIYAHSIYLENKQKILNESTDQQGFHTLGGSFRRKEKRIQIWRDEKPSDFDQVINELLTNDNAN